MDTHHSKLEGKESAGLTLELQGHPLGSAAPTDFGVIRVNVEYSGHSLRKKSKQVTIPSPTLGPLLLKNKSNPKKQ